MKRKPIKIVVYHCRNLRLFEDGGQKEFAGSHPGLKLVAIPCSGRVEAHHLLKTLAGGAVGVLVLACKENACQFLEGSMRSHKRADYARTWLTRVGIEPERIEFVHVPPKDVKVVERVLEEFAEQLQSFEDIPVAHSV
jgi:F420-non-reducing hydrogenase iron-sulfur subunit